MAEETQNNSTPPANFTNAPQASPPKKSPAKGKAPAKRKTAAKKRPSQNPAAQDNPITDRAPGGRETSTITIGKNATFDNLKDLGYMVAANQNPRPRDRKVMEQEGWKKLEVMRGEVFEDVNGVWAMKPRRMPEGMFDKTRHYCTHRAQTGFCFEQDGKFFNQKGAQINKPKWLEG